MEKLRHISLETWWKEAWHEEFGPMTLLAQASYFVKHEQAHLPQIAHLRSQLSQKGRAAGSIPAAL